MKFHLYVCTSDLHLFNISSGMTFAFQFNVILHHTLALPRSLSLTDGQKIYASVKPLCSWLKNLISHQYHRSSLLSMWWYWGNVDMMDKLTFWPQVYFLCFRNILLWNETIRQKLNLLFLSYTDLPFIFISLHPIYETLCLGLSFELGHY